MTNSELIYEVKNRVALLTINRPERLNAYAWTSTLEQTFKEAIQRAWDDHDVRCVVLTGAGKAFCNGMDMEVLKAGASRNPARSESRLDEEQKYGYLDKFDKPSIAAISGAAEGVGLCLALRFVTPEAKLTVPYARRGLVAEHGIAWLLLQLIGPSGSVAQRAHDHRRRSRPDGACECCTSR